MKEGQFERKKTTLKKSLEFSVVMVNAFLTNFPILHPPENTRKPLFFFVFSGAIKMGNIVQKWINLFILGFIPPPLITKTGISQNTKH